MSTDRCVFMPFKRDQVGDFIDEAQRAEGAGFSGLAHRARWFSVVCYDDPGKPLKDLGFSLNTRILIAGHGKPGRPYISNSSGEGQKQYLPFNVVCDRLIEKGLPKRYIGAISCDIRHSSESSVSNPAFSDLVARYLHSKGYKLLHTIGYQGPMGAVHERLTGHKFHHRVVDLIAADGSTTTVKTSDWSARKRYSGAWSIPKHLQGLAAANDVCPAY